MFRFALVDPTTGAIFQTGSAATLDDVEAHGVGLGLAARFLLVDETVSDATHYWTGTGFAPYPPRPGPWAVWNGGFWSDPRPPADPAADLAAWRAQASMTRADLVIAAVGAGIIPAADAGPAARGEVTPSIQALIDALPPAHQLEATVRWAASTVIDRTNAILTALAASMGLTDAQLDQLFGLTPPNPEE